MGILAMIIALAVAIVGLILWKKVVAAKRKSDSTCDYCREKSLSASGILGSKVINTVQSPTGTIRADVMVKIRCPHCGKDNKKTIYLKYDPNHEFIDDVVKNYFV